MMSRQPTSRTILLTHPQLYLFLFGFVKMQVDGETCPTGWFGVGCRLRCHCATSLSCAMDGACPGNVQCKTPYFGPGCQYVDLVALESSASTPAYLRDNNHFTCNPNRISTSVRLFLKSNIYFAWYRIHLRQNKTYSSIRTKVNEGIACRSQTIYPVQRTVLDVWCRLDAEVVSLTIEGDIAANICGLQISGGRNVALKQRVQQSSNYNSSQTANVRAENAVDGNIVDTYAAGSCTRTDFQASSPTWNLTFDQPYWLRKITIYNNRDNKEWLDGFSLETLNVLGNRTFLYKDIIRPSSLKYEIQLILWEPVKILVIRTAPAGSQLRRSLSLCEVEALGESVCSRTKYGFYCNQTCHCGNNIKCSVITGTCATVTHYVCTPGTYGPSCQHPCHVHCHFNICDADSGHCLQCVPGYSGQFCNQACPPGRFGPACRLRCSPNCAEPCHFATGDCRCTGNFSGSLCSECVKGWYGVNCSMRCPPLCDGGLCDQRTGECLACIGNRIGSACRGCTDGFYGGFCDKACPSGCKNRLCNPISGACSSCVEGVVGEFCFKEVESDILALWMMPMLIPILLVAVCCCTAGRKPRPPPVE